MMRADDGVARQHRVRRGGSIVRSAVRIVTWCRDRPADGRDALGKQLRRFFPFSSAVARRATGLVNVKRLVWQIDLVIRRCDGAPFDRSIDRFTKKNSNVNLNV